MRQLFCAHSFTFNGLLIYWKNTRIKWQCKRCGKLKTTNELLPQKKLKVLSTAALRQ
jgi:hypothetical protein